MRNPHPDNDRRAGLAALAALKRYLAGTALSELDAALLHKLRELGSASERELADALSLARSTASRHAVELSGMGLVTERISPGDMRRTHLSVSGSGENVLFEITKAIGADQFAAAVDAIAFLEDAVRSLSAANGTRLSTAAFAALYLLSFGAMPACALAEALGQKQPTTSMMLKRLAEQGYIALEANPADARGRIAALTQEGGELIFDGLLHQFRD